jgi:hypothetical protein
MRYATLLSLLLVMTGDSIPSTRPNVDLVEGNGLLEACISRQEMNWALKYTLQRYSVVPDQPRKPLVR